MVMYSGYTYGDHLTVYTSRSTPGTNIICVTFTSIKKKKEKKGYEPWFIRLRAIEERVYPSVV